MAVVDAPEFFASAQAQDALTPTLHPLTPAVPVNRVSALVTLAEGRGSRSLAKESEKV